MNELINDVKCTRLDHYGRGIAKVDNKTVFIHNLLPKETANIKIVKKNSKYMEAVVVDIVSKTITRVDAPCPYYDNCGGCHIMHMDDDEKKEFKYLKIKDVLKKFAFYNGEVKPLVIGENYKYRNKITLHVNKDRIGLYQSYSNNIVEIDDCMLLDPSMNKYIPILRDYFKQVRGDVTEVIIRKTNDNIIINFDNDIDISKLNIDDASIYVKGSLVKGKDNNLIEINGYKFKVSPYSFFQVNNEIASKIYDKVRELVKKYKPDTLLDLYCGTGTMGIINSKYANKVIGIDNNESCIKDANSNKELNEVDNVEFICGNTEDELDSIRNADMVIVDPPRAGLLRKAVDDLMKIEPKEIIYVSCDPITLARDISLLNPKYKLEYVEPYDMFPNTYHVECVCVLVKR